MPRVSVIIPSYNHGKYIAETIQSVLDQTFQDFEIVITDDGSTDNTVEEIKKFKDPRIRLFVFEKNKGACTAADNCVLEAKGEFVAMLSSDDIFLPHKLEKQVAFLDSHKENGAVFGYAHIIDEDGADLKDENHFYYNIFKQPNRTRFEWLNYFFYKGNCLCHPSALIRRKIYDEVGFYDDRLAQLPDFDMWVRLCLRHDIHIMHEDLIKFRVRAGEANASGNRPEVMSRSNFEFSQLLRHYLEIDSAEDLLKVFPEAANYGRVEKEFIPYFIAKLALEVDTFGSVHKAFALQVLFDMLGNPATAALLEQKYGFRYIDFIKLSAKCDIFNTTDPTLKLQLAERDKRINEILDSTSWKITSPLRQVLDVFKTKDYFLAKLKLRNKNSVYYKNKLERTLVEDPVAVIIPTKNAGAEFKAALAKIVEQELIKNLKIIIIDSGSQDETLSIAKSHGAKIIEIPAGDFNHGQTRNLAAQSARDCKYLVFMTQDALPVGKFWLCDLINAFKIDPLIAAVTVKQEPRKDADIFARWSMWNHYNFLNFDKTQIMHAPDVARLSYLEKRRITQLDNVCSAYKSEYFFENYFQKIRFAEDLEYGYRMLKHGYKLFYLSDASVIHSHNRDAAYTLKRCYVESTALPAILEYSPIRPRVSNIDVLLKDTHELYSAIKNALANVNFEKPFASFKKKLSKINFESGNIEIVDAALEKMISEINRSYDLKEVQGLSKANLLLGTFLRVLDSFEAFVKKYNKECVSEKDFKESLMRLFATVAGSALGNCAYYERDKKIDKILSENI